MRYLALALFAEGPSDLGFLQRVLLRAVHETASQLVREAFEVQETFVRNERYQKGDPRAKRIRDAYAALIASGAITILFIHADGGGDAVAARKERIDPAKELLAQTVAPDLPYGIVGVVPVRETEAWALADKDVLVSELGVNRSELALLSTNVEQIPDPKAALAELIEARARRRSRRRQGQALPAALGERVRLERLRSVPAFKEFETELLETLKRVWRVP